MFLKEECFTEGKHLALKRHPADISSLGLVTFQYLFLMGGVGNFYLKMELSY